MTFNSIEPLTRSHATRIMDKVHKDYQIFFISMQNIKIYKYKEHVKKS